MNGTNYRWGHGGPTHAHVHFMQPILDFLPKQNNLNILDLGCGNGYLAGELSKIGHRVTAVDDSEDGIRIGRDTHQNVNFIKLSLYDDSLSAIAGEDYDVVISSEVIEHLYYPRLLLKAAFKVLKNGGRLIITTPYHGYLINLAMAMTGRLDRHFTVDWDGGHIKFFSTRTLSAMVEESGFENIRFKCGGRFPYLWKSMILCAEKRDLAP